MVTMAVLKVIIGLMLVCTTFGQGCPKIYDPVCGVRVSDGDLKTFGNECLLRNQRVECGCDRYQYFYKGECGRPVRNWQPPPTSPKPNPPCWPVVQLPVYRPPVRQTQSQNRYRYPQSIPLPRPCPEYPVWIPRPRPIPCRRPLPPPIYPCYDDYEYGNDVDDEPEYLPIPIPRPRPPVCRPQLLTEPACGCDEEPIRTRGTARASARASAKIAKRPVEDCGCDDGPVILPCPRPRPPPPVCRPVPLPEPCGCDDEPNRTVTTKAKASAKASVTSDEPTPACGCDDKPISTRSTAKASAKASAIVQTDDGPVIRPRPRPRPRPPVCLPEPEPSCGCDDGPEIQPIPVCVEKRPVVRKTVHTRSSSKTTSSKTVKVVKTPVLVEDCGCDEGPVIPSPDDCDK